MQNKFTYTEKNSFAEVSKNLVRYKSENLWNTQTNC